MKIRDMELLIRVAEAGSMTQAAGQLDLTPAAVSAAVQRIERTIGLRMFERTTRTLRATDEGLVILEGCEDAVRRWQRALDEAHGRSAVLEGTLRIAAPADTTHLVVSDTVARFAGLHPGVRVIVRPTDVLQNVLEDALDVSVRYGALSDSTLVARKLAQSPRVLVASPTYIERCGAPQTLDELANHRLLTLQLGNSPERVWPLQASGGELTSLSVESPLCGDGLLVRRWAVAGHGITFKGLIDVIDDLESGRLVRVLPSFDGPMSPIHAVLPSRTYISTRVRVLVELLAEAFSEREARCDAWLSAVEGEAPERS